MIFIKNKKKIIYFLLIILICVALYFIYFRKNKYDEIENFTTTQDDEQNYNQDNLEDDEEKGTIIVHIMGEVQNEGLVEISEGGRVKDAIDAAGGLKENANIDNINLAFVLSDGMKIIIPSNDETSQVSNEEYITKKSGENVIKDSNSKGENALVNINTADQSELETLPGIGASTAIKIINYRKENGKFNSIEDIKNVSGIGDSKFNNIKDLICV